MSCDPVSAPKTFPKSPQKIMTTTEFPVMLDFSKNAFFLFHLRNVFVVCTSKNLIKITKKKIKKLKKSKKIAKYIFKNKKNP